MRLSYAAAGWTAGLAAMVGAAAYMLAARFALGVSTLPEMFADPVLYVIPAPIFSAVLDTIRFAGKPFLLLVLFLGQLAVGGLVGRYLSGVGPVLRHSLWTCAIIWVVTVAFLMPALGVGFLGALTVAGSLATGVVYLIAYALYATAFAWLYRWLTRPVEPATPAVDRGRRRTLQRIGLGIAGLAGLGIAWEALGAVTAAADATRPPAKLPSSITPVAGFYVVTKDLIGVKVDAPTWTLTVVGNNGATRTFSLPDIQAMPRTELTSTLTCISNDVGGNLIGTARWTGVRLRDLLATVGVGPRAYSVAFSAWDNYADSIPIARALDPSSLLADEIDGAPLPDLHGFPLRLIVPGLYGIKNVKWIKQIEVLDHGFEGYWQARGWTDDATVQTQSQIDVPFDRAVFPSGPVSVGGIAFAGNRGISQVELSPDGGKTWLATNLRQPLSPLAWTTWTLDWHPSTPGWHRLVVRATDGLGQPQRADVTPPIPDGATGYHSIDVRVG
ncbi:MAG TPA: molybdopterin-dependent oxidoreductase [Chloroflexota bacterium]|nr:molybdopterin-dependent oxidoreductase [Chloroflexota bacterium]